MQRQKLPMGLIIGKMMHEMFKVLKKRTFELTEAKLSIEQFGFLYTISREADEVIQKDMAEIMGKDKSVILRMMDSLEDKDLVRRVVDKNDRRKNRIMVSKKGERTIEEYLKIEMDLNDELLEGVSDEELDIFFKVLNHIECKAKMLKGAGLQEI